MTAGSTRPQIERRIEQSYLIRTGRTLTKQRTKIISSNPCDGGRIKLPTIGETVTEIYDKQELAQLLEALKDEPLQFQVLIHLAINTGCRRGELVALEWSDIDFENMKVYVHKSACKPKNKPITIKDTKTHRSHTIDIPDYLVDMLKRHQQEQLDRRLKLGTAWQGRRVAVGDGSQPSGTAPSRRGRFPTGRPHRRQYAHITIVKQTLSPASQVNDKRGHYLCV